MLYHLYEFNHALVSPWRAMAKAGRFFWNSPVNPASKTHTGRVITASLDLFERLTRRYDKPEFGISEVFVDGVLVPLSIEVVWETSFCRLLHFKRHFDKPPIPEKQQKLLIVAPMSGHYATLLRGTVRSLLPHADIYITDWIDARHVPLSQGKFDLEDYVDTLVEILHVIGAGTHVVAVCQPSVPTFVATTLMNATQDPCLPASMILMGGPIDTRKNPTVVNKLAVERGIKWFERNAIVQVPFPYAGVMRPVYPGFLQLTGFMTMNLDRHVDAHRDLFWHLVEGDGDSAEKHRQFYDEYLSVMDLCAEFYLQTVQKVFVEQALPKGNFYHKGEKIDPKAITKTALLTIEGERDDISGVGQTQAAHDLCARLPDSKKSHHLQEKVGHYGVFNGKRFHEEIVPKIVQFMKQNMV